MDLDYFENMTNLIKFCTNIRDFRRKSNFTQFELAEKLGISQTYLSSIEKAKRIPPLEVVLNLFEIFDTTPNDLFGYETPKPEHPISTLPPDIEKLIEKKVQEILQAQAGK